MIRVRCANCGLEISIAATHAGRQIKCPKCKGSIRIPGKDQADASTTESGDPEPDGFRLDPALFDIPAKPTSEAYSGDEPAATLNQQVQELEEEFTGGKPEPPPSRKYPWLLDVLLYPASKPALVIFGIIILIPLVIEIAAVMLGPFWFFVLIPGYFIEVLLALYAYWYFSECIRDSAEGGLRAPETLAHHPGLGEMLVQILRLAACFLLFAAPSGIYHSWVGSYDVVFWFLVVLGVFSFPMGLLAVIMFDSLSGLNPALLLRSIRGTFAEYCGLLLLLCFLLALAYAMNAFLPGIITLMAGLFWLYLLVILGHLLGRFYFRNEQKLCWDV
jgi:phage FluMu protein Com